MKRSSLMRLLESDTTLRLDELRFLLRPYDTVEQLAQEIRSLAPPLRGGLPPSGWTTLRVILNLLDMEDDMKDESEVGDEALDQESWALQENAGDPDAHDGFRKRLAAEYARQRTATIERLEEENSRKRFEEVASSDPADQHDAERLQMLRAKHARREA